MIFLCFFLVSQAIVILVSDIVSLFFLSFSFSFSFFPFFSIYLTFCSTGSTTWFERFFRKYQGSIEAHNFKYNLKPEDHTVDTTIYHLETFSGRGGQNLILSALRFSSNFNFRIYERYYSGQAW